MGMAGVLNLLKWLYISWMCEKIFQWTLKSVKQSGQEKTEDSRKEPVEEVIITQEEEPKKKKKKRFVFETAALKEEDPIKEVEDTKHEEKKAKKNCLFGSTLNAIKSAIFGHRVEDDEDWRKDPKVLSGLSRVDGFKDNGRIKVTSYYDRDNKLVYSKEEKIAEEESKQEQEQEQEPSTFIASGTGQRFANPAFRVKPRPHGRGGDPQAMAVEDAVGKLDARLNDVFDAFDSGIPQMARATVDRHINDTLNDLSTFAVGPMALV